MRQAQADKDVYGMLSEVDHPLTAEGREQAEALAAQLSAAAGATPGGDSLLESTQAPPPPPPGPRPPPPPKTHHLPNTASIPTTDPTAALPSALRPPPAPLRCSARHSPAPCRPA